MGLPYIKRPPEEAVQVLDDCIVSGYEVKDKINEEYFNDRTSVDGEKVTKWHKMSTDWANDCLNKLGNVFVSKKELYEFRDAPVSGLVRRGNMEWNNIINVHEARVKRLTEYDRFIRQEFTINIEVVGRDKITNSGDGKVEIKN